MLKMKFNGGFFPLLLVVSLLAFGATACTEDDDDNNNGTNNGSTQTGDYKKENILPDAYTHYVGKNLEEAEEYANLLVDSSNALCGTAPQGYKCDHDGETLTEPLKCVQLAWVELNEYATRRLQIFNKYISFQQPFFDTLTKKQKLADIVDRVNNTPENLDGGYDSFPVLEAVIYGKAGGAPAKGNNQCKFVLKSAEAIKGQVTALKAAWVKPDNKEAFIQKGKTDAAIKKLFMAMKDTFMEADEQGIAKPAGMKLDGTDDGTPDADATEAPYAKRGGWMVYQVVSRGPLGLYDGSYKQKNGEKFSPSTLEAYVKTLTGGVDLNTKILKDYADLKTKFDAGLQKGDNGLEAAISDTAKRGAIKELIVNIKTIAEDFGQAASLAK